MSLKLNMTDKKNTTKPLLLYTHISSMELQNLQG